MPYWMDHMPYRINCMPYRIDCIPYMIDYTVMVISIRTDRSGQIVQTQIRLLLEEQCDQGLHCLQFHLHLLGEKP